ncbi:MAG: DUF6950 family protein [Cypionkella sp.]
MNWTRHDTRSLIEAAADVPCVSIGMVKTIRRHHGEDGLVERMARFEAFMLATNATPHIWGASDCSLMIADWALANGYPDAAAHLRGRYATKAECAALLTAQGGLGAVVGHCAQSIGLKSLHEPEFGCVAVIGAEARPDRQWSAIWDGHRWMVRWLSKSGPTWAAFAAPAIVMWRI